MQKNFFIIAALAIGAIFEGCQSKHDRIMQHLSWMAVEQNKQLPRKLDDGIFYRKVEVKNETIYQYYSITDKETTPEDVEDIRKNPELFKENTISLLHFQQPQFFAELKKLGVPLVIVFEINNCKPVEVRLTPEDLVAKPADPFDKVISDIKPQLPHEIGNGITFDSCAKVDGTLAMFFTVAESEKSYVKLNSLKSSEKCDSVYGYTASSCCPSVFDAADMKGTKVIVRLNYWGERQGEVRLSAKEFEDYWNDHGGLPE